MVSIYKVENNRLTPDENLISAELRGLSTDTKPTEIGGKSVDNGSVFIEIDTGKLFFYDLDTKTWKEA